MYNLSVHELMYVGTCVQISVSLSGSIDERLLFIELIYIQVNAFVNIF